MPEIAFHQEKRAGIQAKTDQIDKDIAGLIRTGESYLWIHSIIYRRNADLAT